MKKETQAARRVPPQLVLVLGVLGVSFSSILVRFSQAPPLATAAWRMLWAMVVLTPIVLLRHRRELAAVRGRDVLFCGLAGVLLALHFTSWFASLKLTTVASSTVLVCTDVIFAAIGFALFLKGRIPRLGVLAIVVTFGGSVVLAVPFGQGFGQGTGQALLGNALALAGAVFAAGYMLIGRVQRAHLSTNVYTWLVYAFCTAALLGAVGITQTPMLGLGWREVLIGLLLGVVCTLLGHSLLSWSLGYLNPVYVTAVKLAEPVFATVLAMLLFREYPGLQQAIGAVVIIAGIVLFTLAELRKAR